MLLLYWILNNLICDFPNKREIGLNEPGYGLSVSGLRQSAKLFIRQVFHLSDPASVQYP